MPPTPAGLRLEYRPLDALLALRAPRNPKEHSLKDLHAAFARFGYREPVMVGWIHESGVEMVVAGHGRLEALEQARRQKQEIPDGVQLDAVDQRWCVPCVTGLRFATMLEAEAYLIAANQITILGGYQDKALAVLLADLTRAPAGLTGLGFDNHDLNALLARVSDQATAAGAADDVPAMPTDTISRPGDLWRLGQHRLLVGDARDPAAVARLLEGVVPTGLIADPPYGINQNTNYSTMGVTGGRKGSPGTKIKTPGLVSKLPGKAYPPVTGDGTPFDAAKVAGVALIPEQFWFGADYYARSLGDTEHAGCWLVWDKRRETQDDGFGSGFELLWSRQRHQRRLLRFEWFGFLANGDQEAKHRRHPTQKPSALLMDVIKRWIPDTVYDPFAGSGSGLIAAEKLCRRSWSMEIEPAYVDVAVERWQLLTGKKAVREAAAGG